MAELVDATPRRAKSNAKRGQISDASPAAHTGSNPVPGHNVRG